MERADQVFIKNYPTEQNPVWNNN